MSINRQKIFDNSPKSYWIDSVEPSIYPSLEEDTKLDIAIIGGGLAGIQTAYQLSKESLNIGIFEANRIGHGATGYTTAKITSQHNIIYRKLIKQLGIELAQQYASANEAAIHEIKRITDENNIDCDYALESAYVYAQEEKSLKNILDEVESASSLGIEASYVEDIPFSILNKGAIKFDNQAQFHPLKYLYSLAKVISERNVKIFENTRIVHIEEENHNYILTTWQGKK